MATEVGGWGGGIPPGPVNGLARLQAVHAAARRSRLSDGTEYLFKRRVMPYQAQMVLQYVGTGRLSATGGRGAGKSYTLAILAALELEAGHSVLYRTGMGYHADQHGGEQFLKNLADFIGPKAVKAARDAGRIRVPLGGYDRVADGVSVGADLRDEVWIGGYFRKVHAERVAMVGSLPEDTIQVRADARHNEFMPREYREMFAGQFPDPARDAVTLSRVEYLTPLKPASPAASPAVAPEDDVAPCFSVGPS